MDIASHGLWGGVGFGRNNRRAFWLAFFFGVAPDLFSFGVFFVARIFTNRFSFEHNGPPDLAIIPGYIFTLYNVTHSLVVFAVVCGLTWYFRKRLLIPMCAWALHIITDIFTHSDAYFPTPFLWPLSSYHFSGVSWGTPYIFFPNLILLALAYLWWFMRKRTQSHALSKAPSA